MKRLLEFDDDYDFSLLGMGSHVKDYRLCWEINNALNIYLQKCDGIFSQLGDESVEFSTHEYNDEDNHLSYFFISNKKGPYHLVPEFPQLDYLLKLSGAQHEIEIDEIKLRIQEIDVVLTALKLEINQLKSKPNLVF